MSNALWIGTTSDLVQAVQQAHHVVLDTYILSNGRLIDALQFAAQRGADVTVNFGDPPGAAQRSENLAAMAQLERAGVRVAVRPAYGPASSHDKAAFVDGSVYHDDRNFTTDAWETVVIDRRPQPSQHYATTKYDAIAQEAALVRDAKGHDVLVSTESLSPGSLVDALVARARSGDRVRLLYDPATRDQRCDRALAQLRSAGVRVRASASNHKFAVAGSAAWIGSANATAGGGLTREWGMRLPRGLVGELQRIAEHFWTTSKKQGVHAAHPPVHRDSGARRPPFARREPLPQSRCATLEPTGGTAGAIRAS